MSFGDRLKQARLNKGLTQEELAQMIGVAKSTLTNYEKGNREPDFFRIQKLIEALDVSAEYLFEIERPIQPTEDSKMKNSPAPSEDGAEEFSFEEDVAYFTELFTKLGYMQPGGDLSDSDLEFLKAITILLDDHFERRGK